MFPAALIQIIICLVIVGVILWALGQFPIDPTISRIIRVVIIVVVVIWLLYILMGLAGGGPALYPMRR
jgi:hypothetical protein